MWALSRGPNDGDWNVYQRDWRRECREGCECPTPSPVLFRDLATAGGPRNTSTSFTTFMDWKVLRTWGTAYPGALVAPISRYVAEADISGQSRRARGAHLDRERAKP